MNRYRIVFIGSNVTLGNTVEFIEAPSAAEAIAQLALKHENFELLGIKLANASGEAPAPLVDPLVAIESLARALVRCNTILTALMSNDIFRSSLTPERLASLEGVLRDAKVALDLAGVKVNHGR